MIILRCSVDSEHTFSIVSDIKSSGIGRVVKRSIGRGRKKLTKKLDASIENDLIEELGK